MIKTYKILGLMSGSSLDGLDIAFCEFTIDTTTDFIIKNWKLVAAETIPFSQTWVDRLSHLPQQKAQVYAQTHTYFGYYMGKLVNDFLKKRQLQPDYIASHGHTIFHLPEKKFTAQIGCGAALAATTNIPTITDFRLQDVALNGEGAPLAPIADKLLFPENDFMLNLGGIANISCNAHGKYIAFDIGGCNQIFNTLAKEVGQDYDINGDIAAKGQIDEDLFERANSLPFFQQTYPKSLSNQWVQQQQIPDFLNAEDSLENRMRTANEVIAFQIAKALANIIQKENLNKKQFKILASGGGAKNLFFMENLKYICEQIADFEWVNVADELADFKEAILMALMGVMRLEKVVNVMSSVTGAERNVIGGGVYLP